MHLPSHEHVRAAVEGWIPRGSEVALFDVPVHRNAGDLFILAAATDLLAHLGCQIVHRCGVRDYGAPRVRQHVGPGTIMVGLGGGNFGDRYPRYQELRERVAADFPANRIVILPQSIHFAGGQALRQAVERLSGHPDLRIAVRDHGSVELARQFTSHVMLLPDLVHGLGVRPGGADGLPTADTPTLYLIRRDDEGGRGRVSFPGAVDWRDVFPGYQARLAMAALLMPVAPDRLHASLHARWSGYAQALLARGLRRMARAGHVVTDRLHGAILARLAGRPVTLLDHGYGKITAYYEAWWTDDPEVRLER